MFDFIYDLSRYSYVEFGKGLTIPIKNQFYKGKRLTFRYYWFCSECHNTFNLLPKKKYRMLNMSGINCPICHSNRVYHGPEISKAIIDKRSVKEILEIIELFKNINSVTDILQNQKLLNLIESLPKQKNWKLIWDNLFKTKASFF